MYVRSLYRSSGLANPLTIFYTIRAVYRLSSWDLGRECACRLASFKVL